MTTSYPYILGPNSSIQELLDGVSKANGLDQKLMPPLIDKFNKNMVLKVGHLMRLQPQQLQRLNLPLLIEAELYKFIVHDEDAVVRYSPEVQSLNTPRDENSEVSEESTSSKGTIMTPREREELWVVPNDQKEAIRASWKQISEGGRDKTTQFYEVPTQVRALITMTNALVKGLDDLTRLTAMFKKLGAHHMFYGVEVKDYQAFGVVLVEALKKVLGPDAVNTQLQEAWQALFGKVASIMIQGVEEAKKGIKCPVYLRSGKVWKKRMFLLQSGKISFCRPAKDSKSPEKPVEEVDLTNVVNFDSNEEELPGYGHPMTFKLEEDVVKHACVFRALRFEDFQLIEREIDWRLKALHKKLKHHPDFAN